MIKENMQTNWLPTDMHVVLRRRENAIIDHRWVEIDRISGYSAL